MIIIRNLRQETDETLSDLRKKTAKKLRLNPDLIKDFHLVKRSLDARRKNDLHYVCSVAFGYKGGEEAIIAREKNAALYEKPVFNIPAVSMPLRPVVAGFGPAGMFAGLVLSRAGARPIVLERGEAVETRMEKVAAFRAGGSLDPECNVQFGEGGAGTFSDGKLNTGTHDPRLSWVLEEFYAHGAPETVLYDSKPHIGTDVLVGIVRSIREEIIKNGGEVRFSNKLTGLEQSCGRLSALKISSPGGEYTLPCENLILAVGHSARDTFEMLNALGLPMEPKAFSMGVRIEHRQDMIDLAQYGCPREGKKLPPADYSLNVKLPGGDSAYTFCMCPGGEVFAAASEEGGVVTNGMSYSKRDGENANSALLVTLRPEDFPEKDVLGGMRWQREIERAAFKLGGSDYRAPAQLSGDFIKGVPSTKAGGVTPTYRPGVTWCDLNELLPVKITDTLRAAIPELAKRLRGFDAPDAVLTAPETRSSSPVRILREASCRCKGLSGLYPCGEGAGYAGGISSAAVDGVRCAMAILEAQEQ